MSDCKHGVPQFGFCRECCREMNREIESSRSPGCSKAWILALRPAYAVSRGMFSRADHKGYTNDIKDAGRFSEAEALEHAGMHPDKYVALELAKP